MAADVAPGVTIDATLTTGCESSMAILSAVLCLVGCLSIAGVLPSPMDHPIFPLAAFACGTVAAFVRRPVALVWLVINVAAVIVWLWLLQERSRLGGE